MSKYIDTDAFEKWLCDPTKFLCNCEECTEIDCVACIIENGLWQFPNADVEPVRHAHWEPQGDMCGDVYSYKCSNCGCEWAFFDGTPEENSCRFCPECGAKMDEV